MNPNCQCGSRGSGLRERTFPARPWLATLTIIAGLVGCGGDGDDGGSPTDPDGLQPSLSAVSPDSGNVGTRVEITGSQFEAGAAVSFDGLDADSIEFLDSSTLLAFAPGGLIVGELYDVEVTNPGGKSASVAAGGWLLVSGGLYNGASTSSTEHAYASINSDASLGSFNGATGSQTIVAAGGVPFYNHDAVAYVDGAGEAHVVVLGGADVTDPATTRRLDLLMSPVRRPTSTCRWVSAIETLEKVRGHHLPVPEPTDVPQQRRSSNTP